MKNSEKILRYAKIYPRFRDLISSKLRNTKGACESSANSVHPFKSSAEDKIWFHTYIRTYIHTFFKNLYYSDSGTSKTSKFIKIFDSKIFTVTKLSLCESKN